MLHGFDGRLVEQGHRAHHARAGHPAGDVDEDLHLDHALYLLYKRFLRVERLGLAHYLRALVVVQHGAVARAAEEPAWSLEGRMITADSCGVDCPCIIGGPPHHGQCQFVGLCQIDNGQYGDVKLDGAKIGLAGEFVRKI